VAPGGFVVQRLISENNHARAYVATAPDGLAVVVKEVIFNRAPSPRAMEAFEHTTASLLQLSHPRIPRFISAFSEGTGADTRLYLVQSFLPGESLLDRHKQKLCSESEALQVARELLSILKYLHSVAPPVIHRDLKPANLIRGPENTLWLVDFGLARLIEQADRQGVTEAGTFGYAPVGEFSDADDESTDLYGLGATLLSLLTGKAPSLLLDEGFRLKIPTNLPVSIATATWLGGFIGPRGKRFRSVAEAEDALDLNTSVSGRTRQMLPTFSEGAPLRVPALTRGEPGQRDTAFVQRRPSDAKIPSRATWALGVGLPSLFALAFYGWRALNIADQPQAGEVASAVTEESRPAPRPDVTVPMEGVEDDQGCTSLHVPLRGRITSGESVVMNCSVAQGLVLTDVCYQTTQVSLRLKTDAPFQTNACTSGLKFERPNASGQVFPIRPIQLPGDVVQVSFPHGSMTDEPPRYEVHLSSSEIGDNVTLTVDWNKREVTLHDPDATEQLGRSQRTAL
jgi:serine/threonine protein kinase